MIRKRERKGGVDMVYTAAYLLAPILPMAALYLSNPARYGYPETAIPMILGSMAFTWLAFGPVLSSRPRTIEPRYGLDALYRYHGIMALASLVLVAVHRAMLLGYAGFPAAKAGNAAWVVLLTVSALALGFMSSLAQGFMPIAKARAFAIRLRLGRYQNQLVLHNLSMVGLALMLIHVLMATPVKASPAAMAVFTAYFVVGTWYYLASKLPKGRRAFVVDSVEPEARNVWTIRLRPENGGVFDHKPGQFAFLRVLGSSVPAEEHPFTISSSPLDDALSFTIKGLGDYTAGVGGIKPGERALIDGPYGRFTHIGIRGGIVFLAGGVGITPALSMLRHMREAEPDRHAVLVWGVNDRGDLIRQEEFGQMEAAMPNLRIVPVMFRDDGWEGHRGIIDKGTIKGILDGLGYDPTEMTYLVCGPSAMLRTALKGLRGLGVDRSRILTERFSL